MDDSNQNIIDTPEENKIESPHWNRTTKIVIVVISLLLIAFTAQRFRGLIGMVVVAAVIAYLLNPLIEFTNKRTKISRGWVILFIYLALAGAVGWISVALSVAAYEQASELIIL